MCDPLFRSAWPAADRGGTDSVRGRDEINAADEHRPGSGRHVDRVIVAVPRARTPRGGDTSRRCFRYDDEETLQWRLIPEPPRRFRC